MNKKLQISKYVIADFIGTALAWAAFFIFRKTVVENVPCSELGTMLHDNNLWLGLLLMPFSWIALYAIQGTYRNVFRKSRLNELKQTLLATHNGSVEIFFVLLLDDRITSYKYYYLLFDYANFLYDYSLYYDSETIYERAISLAEELYGPEHANTAATYNKIGMVYYMFIT